MKSRSFFTSSSPRSRTRIDGLTPVAVSTRSRQVLTATGVNPSIRVRDLGDDDVKKLRDFIDASYKVEGDLRREVAQNIKRKVEIGSYQGIRHRRGLPVRGQRTHTNARTRKG